MGLITIFDDIDKIEMKPDFVSFVNKIELAEVYSKYKVNNFWDLVKELNEELNEQILCF